MMPVTDSSNRMIVRARNGMAVFTKLVAAPKSATMGIRVATIRHAALKADLRQGPQHAPLTVLMEPVDEAVSVARKVLRNGKGLGVSELQMEQIRDLVVGLAAECCTTLDAINTNVEGKGYWPTLSAETMEHLEELAECQRELRVAALLQGNSAEASHLERFITVRGKAGNSSSGGSVSTASLSGASSSRSSSFASSPSLSPRTPSSAPSSSGSGATNRASRKSRAEAASKPRPPRKGREWMHLARNTSASRGTAFVSSRRLSNLAGRKEPSIRGSGAIVVQ